MASNLSTFCKNRNTPVYFNQCEDSTKLSYCAPMGLLYRNKIQIKMSVCCLTPGIVTVGLLLLPQFYTVHSIQNARTIEVSIHLSMYRISNRGNSYLFEALLDL